MADLWGSFKKINTAFHYLQERITVERNVSAAKFSIEDPEIKMDLN